MKHDGRYGAYLIGIGFFVSIGLVACAEHNKRKIQELPVPQKAHVQPLKADITYSIENSETVFRKVVEAQRKRLLQEEQLAFKYVNFPKIEDTNKKELAVPQFVENQFVENKENLHMGEEEVKDAKNQLHGIRYTNKKVKHRILVWTWKGGKQISQKRLSSTIYNVLERTSMCPVSKEIHDIILETSAIESLRGLLVKQKRGPALGIYQMEPETKKDLIAWLKSRHPDIYREVMVFYERKKSEEWNDLYNIPWQTALCLVKYWHVAGKDLQDLTVDRKSRATLWRLRYNTLKGKGSVALYLKKVEQYIDVS